MKKLITNVIFIVCVAWMPTLLNAATDTTIPDDSPFYGESKEPHHFTFLKTGPVALQARLDLIENAQESIEFEYFVFKADEVGRLLLQALAERARAGVEVRVMFDHFGSFSSVGRYLVQELINSGVQFRAYNQTLLHPYYGQFRNHRKLIVVDGETVLTGGRNVSKRYYGVSDSYNLADRDFILTGEIVKKMRESFFGYWNSDVVTERSLPGKVRRRNFIRRFRERRAQEKMTRSRQDERFLQELSSFVEGDMKDLPQSECHDITYVTDRPGVGSYALEDDHRFTRQVVYRALRSAEHRAYIESPYIVFDDAKEEVIQELLDKGIEVSFKTNSLRATNVLPVTAVFYDQIKPWLDAGVDAYLFRGDSLSHHEAFPGTEDAEWGIHSKGMLFDYDHVMLGSFNFDPRSTVWNSEYAVFCRDENVARIISESVEDRLNFTHHLLAPEDVREYGFEGVGLLKRLMYQNIRYPSNWLSFLL